MNNENPHQPDNSFNSYPFYRPNGEVPFIKAGKRYLFVKNLKDRTDHVYSYSDDLFIDYREFIGV